MTKLYYAVLSILDDCSHYNGKMSRCQDINDIYPDSVKSGSKNKHGISTIRHCTSSTHNFTVL